MSLSPIVLHCSAGIGRTGCLVLIELVLEKLLCNQNCSDMGFILIELRKQRANLVQNITVCIFIIHKNIMLIIVVQYFKKLHIVCGN